VAPLRGKPTNPRVTSSTEELGCVGRAPALERRGSCQTTGKQEHRSRFRYRTIWFPQASCHWHGRRTRLRAYALLPGRSIGRLTEAILKDKKKILPCAAYLEGEYGINGLYVGVPCKLGARGLEQIIEINLLAEERIALQKSAAPVQELIDVLGI
jgi:hypothetical protein